MDANTVGDRNTAVGSNALTTYNPSGNEDGYNTAIGMNAMFSTTTGNNNTAVGGKAMEDNTTGAQLSLIHN